VAFLAQYQSSAAEANAIGRLASRTVPFLDQCDLCVTAFDQFLRYGPLRLSHRADIGAEAGMIGNVMSDGRLLSLQATEWLILIVGGLAGSLILMF
jgi:hypothetical protein